ncbi:MAG: type II toxin-antitoxin system HicB family antitoxin [Candidatus Methylomirabilia bacterium]
MKFEVIVEQTERGEFVATAVEYPGVSARGRTEPEALALVTKAVELHLKQRPGDQGSTRTPPPPTR